MEWTGGEKEGRGGAITKAEFLRTRGLTSSDRVPLSSSLAGPTTTNYDVTAWVL